jgi:chitinase
MLDSCGPGKYAVAKSFWVSDNQEVPEHLAERDLGSSQVYDLTYDYEFHRVPEPIVTARCVWISVMKRVTRIQLLTVLVTPNANVTTPIIRTLSAVWKKNGARLITLGAWIAMSFTSGGSARGVIAWLANLIGVSEAEHTEEFTHSVSEKLKVILIDQQFGPCPVGPAQA